VGRRGETARGWAGGVVRWAVGHLALLAFCLSVRFFGFGPGTGAKLGLPSFTIGTRSC
jgi:hypothetical protein